MTRRTDIQKHLLGLIDLFKPHCEDQATLGELAAVVADDERWSEAHSLFERIRARSLDAIRKKNSKATAQHDFEEACAKTIYNLDHSSGAFDPDSPYWIIPKALTLASALGLSESDVIRIVSR